MQRRHFFAAAAASCAAAGAFTSTPVRATRAPVRIAVPAPAGHAIDLSVRRMAAALQAELGPIYIDNHITADDAPTGAAMAAVAQAPADGLTLAVASAATHAIAPWFDRAFDSATGYDAAQNFAPITQMARAPLVLVVRADTAQARGIDSLAAWLEWARQSPTPPSYASTGTASLGHLASAWLQHATHSAWTRHAIPATALPSQAVLAGEADGAFDHLAHTVHAIQAGSLLPLAVTSGQRSALLPDVPTVTETVAGFQISDWWGLVAPAATPAEVVQQLNTLAVKALHSSEVVALYRDLRIETATSTPEAFGAWIRHELTHWEPIVRATVRATV